MSEVAVNIEESPSEKEEYKIVQINDVVKKITGGCSTKKSDYFDDGVLVLNKGHIKTYGSVILGKNRRYVTEGYADENPSKIIDSNTVLVTLRDLSVKADFLGLIGIYRGASKAIITQGMYALELHDNVDAKYLIYFSNSPAYRVYVKRTKVGSTQVHLRNGHFLDAMLPLPSVGQQKRIVAKIEELFSHIDAGIAALNKAKQLLKQYRESVLKAAVTGELTKQWREDNKDKLEPSSQLLERILQERRQKWEAQQLELFKAKGKMPKDDGWKGKYIEPEKYSGDGYQITDVWLMARAEQVCDFITKGTTPKKERLSAGSGEVPFIKVYNLTFDTSLNFDLKPTYTDTETHNDFLARSKVYPDDVLMNIVGPPLGKVSIVSDIHKEWNINQAIAVYRPLNGLSNKLLAYFLLSRPVVDWMQSKTKTTAGQVNLTLEISRNAPIPILSEEEQEEAVRLIEEKLISSDRMLNELEKLLIKAGKNKQSILASAFSGRLS
jgi:type I restriction enzyme S subunit